MKLVVNLSLVLLLLANACGADGTAKSLLKTPTPTADNISDATRFTIQENYPGFCHVDGVVENTYTGYQASGYANPAKKAGAYVEWRVETTQATTLELVWLYATEVNDLTAIVEVNHKPETIMAFGSSVNADRWQENSLPIKISGAGHHSIRLRAATAKGLPLIDALTVSGSGLERINCDGSRVIDRIPNPRCVAGAYFENESVDCGGARVGLSCDGDSETQPPVLTLHNASVKNLIIKADGGSDGIHCRKGECVLDNVIWEDICEDAATLKGKNSRLTVRGGWAFNGKGGVGGKPDKIFQNNGVGNTFIVTDNFTAKGHNGTFWRSCGGCTNNHGPRNLVIDNVRIEGKIKTIAVPNVNKGYEDSVNISNLAIENYKEGKPIVCRAAIGWKKNEQEPEVKFLGEKWNTENCQVDPSDIVTF